MICTYLVIEYIYITVYICLKHTLKISINISGINKLAQDHMKKDKRVKKLKERERNQQQNCSPADITKSLKIQI